MKIRNRGIVAAFATVATAALLCVGVAPVQAATQTVTIWSGSKTAADNPINAALVAFGKKNGININIVLKPTAMREAFIAAVPTGKGPDLMIGAHDWTGQLVGAGVVAPVTLGAASSKFSVGAKAGLSVGGKLYGVPTWTENIALLWNKRDGVDPKGQSFQALLDSKSGLAIPHDKVNGDPYHFSSIASSFGNTLFTRDGNGWTKTIGYGGAGAAGYANFLATQGSKIITPADGWDKTACALQSGNYVISGPWMYNHAQDTISGCASKPLAKSEIGVAVIPSLGGSPVHQFSGVYGVWKSVKVAGKANALAVGKVLNFIASADAQLGFYKSGNVIPANTDALAKVSDAGLKGFGIAGQGAYPMPSYVFMDTVWDKIGKAEAALIAGKFTGSATDFLRKSVAVAQSLIDGK